MLEHSRSRKKVQKHSCEVNKKHQPEIRFQVHLPSSKQKVFFGSHGIFLSVKKTTSWGWDAVVYHWQQIKIRKKGWYCCS
jgi:hypothetical protein